MEQYKLFRHEGRVLMKMNAITGVQGDLHQE